MNKIENIDFSDIGLNPNQEYFNNDYSQDKSILNQLRNENPNNTSGLNSQYVQANGQSSSPFTGYLSEKTYGSQPNITGGKNVKLNIADLQSLQQQANQQFNQTKSNIHSRYGSNGEGSLNNTATNLKQTIKSQQANVQYAQQQPPQPDRTISQQNYKNLKNTAISNSPISPQK
jgi:hypothetical protein